MERQRVRCAAAAWKESMRSWAPARGVRGARRGRNQWGDARRCVSAGENVEFFHGARRRAFAGKCVSAASSELTVARRRRKESLPPLAMLQTRAAASRGPKPVGPALCWKHVQATGGHAVRFLKLPSTAEVPSSCYSPSLRCPRANTAARPILEDACRRTSSAASRASNPGVSGSIRRRVSERERVRWILQPARPP